MPAVVLVIFLGTVLVYRLCAPFSNACTWSPGFAACCFSNPISSSTASLWSSTTSAWRSPLGPLTSSVATPFQTVCAPCSRLRRSSAARRSGVRWRHRCLGALPESLRALYVHSRHCAYQIRRDWLSEATTTAAASNTPTTTIESPTSPDNTTTINTGVIDYY